MRNSLWCLWIIFAPPPTFYLTCHLPLIVKVQMMKNSNTVWTQISLIIAMNVFCHKSLCVILYNQKYSKINRPIEVLRLYQNLFLQQKWMWRKSFYHCMDNENICSRSCCDNFVIKYVASVWKYVAVVGLMLSRNCCWHVASCCDNMSFVANFWLTWVTGKCHDWMSCESDMSQVVVCHLQHY